MQDEEVCKVSDDTHGVNGRLATRAVNVQGAFLARDLNYSDYLQLDKILHAQVNSCNYLRKNIRENVQTIAEGEMRRAGQGR